MFKEEKKKIIISSILILLPTLAGFLMWDRLPETMVMHWGLDGTGDGVSTKLVTITIPFLFMLLTHWVCLFFTGKDRGNKDQNRKVKGMIIWIMPVVSMFAGYIIYSAALGLEKNIGSFTITFLGIVFIIIGNYLPKCKQNSTIGIKIKWTLQNEENWNATHRFGGKVWVIGGILFLTMMFFPKEIAMTMFLGGMILFIAAPVVYSYSYYRKQKEQGTWSVNRVIYDEKNAKLAEKITVIVLIPILVFVAVILFTGEIDYNYGETSLRIEASYWSDITVKYENIEAITYMEDVDFGSRVSGFGSIRLGMGSFENEEFGYYTRYCYETCKDCVVLNVGNKKLVINGKDKETTQEIYETLSNYIN